MIYLLALSCGTMITRRRTALWTRRLFLFGFAVAVFLIARFLWQTSWAGSSPAWLDRVLGERAGFAGRKVGLIAGHKGNDTGAMCRDGLTEAEINLAVAEKVAQGLRDRGARVEILDEFDDHLRGYRADAFVSIHSDSCTVDWTGFKVASLEGGSDASVRLATCLWDGYEAETGLARHESTVTLNMTRYHAFRKVARSTPAAIIELGFMGGDRDFLTQNQDEIAAGILDGLACFLDPDPAPEVTSVP